MPWYEIKLSICAGEDNPPPTDPFEALRWLESLLRQGFLVFDDVSVKDREKS